MKQSIRIIKIILGNLILAFSISTFVVQNGIISGGVSGIGLAMEHFFGLSVSTSVMLINVVLFIFGYFIFGRDYAFTTLLSTILFPIFLNFFSDLHCFDDIILDQFVICLLAGVCNGIGIGMVIREGSSTGGLVILTQIIQRYTHIPLDKLVSVCDISVLVLQVFYKSFDCVIYGIMIVLITSYVMKRVITNGRSLIQIIVISKKWEQLKECLLNEMDCGVTLFHGTSGMESENINVLLSIVPYQKIPQVRKRLVEIDENAFLIVHSIDEVSDRSRHLSESVS